MVDLTSHKPVYVAMEDSEVSASIVRSIRRYPNLETLRVAKPPGKLTLYMLERKPLVVFVDVAVAPGLIAKAKSLEPRLRVAVVASREEINRLPFILAPSIKFLGDDATLQEVHAVLDSFSDPGIAYGAPTPVGDMIAVLAVGNQNGVLEIRNTQTNETGTITIQFSHAVDAQLGPFRADDAIDQLKRWSECEFEWSPNLESFESGFLEEVSLSLLADASDLVSDERGLVEATDTSMFPMTFDSNEELEDVSDMNLGSFLQSSIGKEKLSSRETISGVAAVRPGIDETSEVYRGKPFFSEPESHSDIGGSESKTPNFSTRDAVPDASPTSQETDEPWRHNLDIGVLMASNANEILQELTGIAGFIAGAVVDSDSGMTLAKLSNSMAFDIDVAAATNTEVIKAKLRAAKALKLDDAIEDILITLTGQYHMLRPLEEYPSIFFYVALDRETANLAMARLKLKTVGSKIKL